MRGVGALELEIGLVTDAAGINAKDPSRAPARKPIRRGFDDSSGEEVIWLAEFVLVLVVSRDDHAGVERNSSAGFILGDVRVGEAEKILEEPVEVSL
jgi:hypothetical protein